MARILIIDDDESDRVLLEAILTGAGHEVIASDGGEQALKRHLEGGVELIVTDLDMPDVHGFELISIFRDFVPAPPIIAVSGSGQFQLHMARELGAIVTLNKPIDAPRLVEAVERELTRQGSVESL